MALVASLVQQGGFNGQDRGQGLIWLQFKVTAIGNYPANGDTLDLSVIAPPGCGSIPTGQVSIQSQPLSGNVHSGYTYCYIVGSTQKNGKMQLLLPTGASNALTDVGNQNPYPNAVSGDNIIGTCAFAFGQ